MSTRTQWGRLKIILLIPLLITVAVPFSLFNTNQSASAVYLPNGNGGSAQSSDPAKQTDLWYEFTAMEYCFRYSPIETDSAKVASGQLFYDNGHAPAIFSGWLSKDYPNNTDACGANNSIISTSALKSFGVTNTLDFVCSTLRYTRNNNQSCAKGTNQFNDNGGRYPNDLADAWHNEFKDQITVGGTGDLPTDKSSVAYVYYKRIYVNVCTTGTIYKNTDGGSDLTINSLDEKDNDITEYYVQSGTKSAGDDLVVSVYTDNGNGTITSAKIAGGKSPIKLRCDQLKGRVNNNFPAYKSAKIQYDAQTYCLASPQSYSGATLVACENGVINKTNVTYCADTYTAEEELAACKFGAGATELNKAPPILGKAPAPSCAIDGIGWIICPVINFMAGVADGAFGFLASSFLQTSPNLVNTSETNGTYTAWKYMRTLANVAFVIVFLIIIFSQLTGFGVTNYGVKKLLPRIVVAAILVNISFFICQLAVDVSNILGYSLKDVFDSISSSINSTSTVSSALSASNSLVGNPTTGQGFSGVAGAVLVIGTGGVIGYALISTLIPVLLAAVVALLVILFILVARQAIVVLLIVLSPLAFVAYLLPNTENLFKQWRKMLTAMLMLFPIVAIVFGASTLASHLLTDSFNGASGVSKDDNNVFGQIIASAILVVPLFAVPVLLKKALDGIPMIGQMASKFSSGAQGGVKGGVNKYRNSDFGKFRAGKKAERQAYIRAGKYTGKGGVLNPRNLRSKVNDVINNSSLYDKVTQGFGSRRNKSSDKWQGEEVRSKIEQFEAEGNDPRKIYDREKKNLEEVNANPRSTQVARHTQEVRLKAAQAHLLRTLGATGAEHIYGSGSGTSGSTPLPPPEPWYTPPPTPTPTPNPTSPPPPSPTTPTTPAPTSSAWSTPLPPPTFPAEPTGSTNNTINIDHGSHTDELGRASPNNAGEDYHDGMNR